MPAVDQSERNVIDKENWAGVIHRSTLSGPGTLTGLRQEVARAVYMRVFYLRG